MRNRSAHMLAAGLLLAWLPAAGAQEEVPGLLLKADQMLKRNRGTEAVELYKKANEAGGGKCAECLAGLATAFNQIGAFKEAVDAAQKLIALDTTLPLKVRGYEELGIAQAKRPGNDPKNLASAEEAFRIALDLSKGAYNEGRYALGIILLRQGRDEDGVAALTEFLKNDPDSRNAAHARQLVARPLCARAACAPEFSTVTTDGEYVTLESLKGKVTLLHFYMDTDTWQDEMWPDMKRLAMWTKKHPVQILGVPVIREEDRIRRMMQLRGMTWPQCIDKTYTLGRAFQVTGYPATVLVDHEGMIQYRRINWATELGDELNQQISMAVEALKKAEKARQKTEQPKS